MNAVHLIGRLTKDLDLRFTQNGTAVGTFNLAVNRSFTNQQGEREADFINCVIWKKGAENLAKYTRKGSKIGIDGRIQTRNYENQQGQRVYVTEVIVERFDLLDSRNSQNNSDQQANNNNGVFIQNTNKSGQAPMNSSDFNYQNQDEMNSVDISEDDLPF
ncbi:single-stranded DNA-binding protein [Facklamia hominis]|uniref:single-stranded DNA-binding protein n=1 Tax=Facklamia hominis TaxID=178214 RepID=UPI0003531BA0|nr:single-stranded DNA-binding protein [Facklamia hominis]EPH12553.1 single-stranded DNA-binding protein [Facklamia hominis ACS-120-V-Sch10]